VPTNNPDPDPERCRCEERGKRRRPSHQGSSGFVFDAVDVVAKIGEDVCVNVC